MDDVCEGKSPARPKKSDEEEAAAERGERENR